MAEWGVNFRGTTAYRSDDAANHTLEVSDPSSFDLVSPTYPHASTNGTNVGWENLTGTINCVCRNRQTTGDVRTGGTHSFGGGDVGTYRFDLPSAGDYLVRVASGDRSYAQNTKIALRDTTTSLGTLFDGNTGGAGRFFDANGTAHTSSTNWVTNNVRVSKTFSTTIARFDVGGSTTGTAGCVNHLSMESAGGSPYTLTAAAGSFSLTGNATGLKAARQLAAAQASFSLTGNAALLKAGRNLPAVFASYTLTGNAATLTKSGSGARTLTADVASYTLTGIATGLKAARKLVASVGTFSLSGKAAGLARGLRLTAASRSYALTGIAASFRRTYAISATTAAYVLTGNDAALTWSGAPVEVLPTTELNGEWQLSSALFGEWELTDSLLGEFTLSTPLRGLWR